MKTIKRICQFIILIAVIFLWILFIGGADSLMENGIMLPAIAIVAFATYLCHFFIKKEDLETILHIKTEDNEI